jgi:dGTPase
LRVTPGPVVVGEALRHSLAHLASRPELGRGRRFHEPADPARNDFQRDRDRIVHSTAFRRLVYKTQVFLNHEGDLFRTRLTHSLEVAQIGRSMARVLALHEDLVEGISLAHDLGHTPFGHAGQDALNEAVRQHEPNGPGFEHNLQSLRVVDELEEQYPRFNGLNLCFDTREGILKHCSRANAQRLEQQEPGSPAQRFLTPARPSLEAQLCNLADEIAYNAHDIDDGLRSGLLDLDALGEVPVFGRFSTQVRHEFPALQGRRLVFETTRRMLSAQILDVVASTLERAMASGARNAQEVRGCQVLVGFSDGLAAEVQVLKAFLRERLYRHPQVMDTTGKARVIVQELFSAYLSDVRLLPDSVREKTPLVRSVADYLAGMTDRFATREHQRITGQRLFD